MSRPTYHYVTDPLVSQNDLRNQRYAHAPIPLFIEIKKDLPEPVLPDYPTWVEMYWRAWELAWSNLRRPTPENGFVANYIDPAFNGHIFLWNSAFMMQFGVYGRCAFNFIGTLNNFYAKQHDDGFICREIDSLTGCDHFYPFDPNGTGPNILAWAEWRHFRATGDDGRLTQVFPVLLAYHRWCRAHRTWPSSLYWATGMSSGMDNQPRVPDSLRYHRHWSWVDATLQAVLSSRVLSHMAAQLGEEQVAAELNDERSRLIPLINSRLWNEELKFYQDVSADGRFSRIKSVGAYWALMDKGIVPEDRVAEFVQPLRENWAFRMIHRVPSQSADSEGYNALTGNQWRGGVWPNANYMVLKGLRNKGFDGLAHEIALNHLSHVCDVYQRTDTIWEYYAPESVEPGADARPNVVGMSGLTPIAILLEDVIGISIDWPQRRVTWDCRLETTQGYGVRNYPLGTDGTMDLLRNGTKAVVTTDTPFTLTIKLPDENVQAAVSSGTTEIDLT
jgi:hypothetical protein